MNRRLFLFVVVFLLAIPVTRAHAEPNYYGTRWTFDPSTGVRKLWNRVPEVNGGSDLAEVMKEYSPSEWQAKRSVVEVEDACVGASFTNCGDAVTGGNTGVTGATSGEATAGSDVLTAERLAGTSLPADVAGPVDALAVGTDVAALGLGSFALGAVTLAPTAFFLGVDIGNGVDQLFEIPKWDEESVYKEWHEHGCSIIHTTSTEEGDSSIEEGGSNVKLPPGYYGDCGFLGLAMYATLEIHHSGSIEHPGSYNENSHSGALLPVEHEEIETVANFSYTLYEGAPRYEEAVTLVHRVYYGWDSSECSPPEPSSEWLKSGGEVKGCVPAGVPAPGLLSSGQESVNESHGVPRHPSVPGPELPTKPTITQLPNRTLENFLTNKPAREYIEVNQKKTDKELAKEKEEEEKKIIPIPGQNESAVEYKDKMLGEAFTNVVIKTVAESAINPSVAPEDVAAVDPAPGLSVTANTAVEIDANPANAPVPAEPISGIGGPTLPGIKIPDFGVLCQGFPFGVPCWLIKTVEKWSASPKAPEWGTEEMTIIGHKIPAAKFDLSKLEPIMSPVRAAMIIFCTFGIVLLFYKFAMGGGPPTGTATPTDSDE